MARQREVVKGNAREELRGYLESARGRAVRGYGCPGGLVLEWEPLTAALCDCLVLLNDNTECWFSMADLKPVTSVPLPSRTEALRLSKIERRESLEQIRDNLIRDIHVPWPGMNFGKAHLGNAIVKALDDLDR